MATRIIKGQVVTFQDDPFALEDPTAAVLHHSDGAVWIVDGVIRSVGTWSDLKAELGPALDSTPVEDYGDHLIVPGFVDCHAHYPQLPIIASYGTQLLEWLQKYTFPMEVTYRDPEVSRAASAFYLDQCLANGITTACVYATVHPVSAEMFFQEAEKRNMRMASGKVLMDRNAPDGLRDTAETGYTDSEALIKRWHRKGRALYCLTPRFAATSTHEQLEAAKALRAAYPDILMQTHLSENHKEIAWIAELFPEAPDYFGVYERAGLAGPGSIFGHGIHLTDRELAAIRETGSALAHCPTSNLFIGSGLFDMQGLRHGPDPVPVGLATDVAGGSSLSMFATMRAAYEIAQLRGYSLHPLRAWYLATRGSAATMGLDGVVGCLAPGAEADLVVLDPTATPMLAQRANRAEALWEVLFALIVLGDDRAVRATYVAGDCAHDRTVSA